MHYILTKEEYDNLVSRSRYNEEKAKVEKLNARVLELSGFTCIKDEPRLCVYCDDCPVVDTCTQLKQFSK